MRRLGKVEENGLEGVMFKMLGVRQLKGWKREGGRGGREKMEGVEE